MKIRAKTLIVLGLIMITIMATFYFLAYQMTSNNISVSEEEDSSSNSKRFVNNLNIDLNSISSMVSDWGSWDDTYKFVEDNDTAYIESNLVDQTFVNLHVNMILFFDQNDQIVWGGMFYDKNSIPVEIAVLEQISTYKRLFINNVDRTESGLIKLNDMPMLVASHPILTSMHEGPTRGTLMMGRLLDQSELDTLALAVGLPLTSVVIGNQDLSKDFQIAELHLSSDKIVFNDDLNETHMAGYVLLKDVNNASLAIVKVTDYRTEYLNGREGLMYTGASIAALGVTLFMITAFLLDKLVISRLTNLETMVIKIRKTGDNSKRVVVRGNDELSSLGENINGMLNVIEEHTINLEETVNKRTQDLRESQEKLTKTLNACPDAIINTDFEGRILDCNPQMTQLCSIGRDDLLNKPALNFIDKEDSQRVLAAFSDAAMNKNRVVRLECRLLKNDGTTYPAELSASVLRDEQETPVGFVSIVRDLTEKKALEQRLFKAERLAAIGELAGIIGHDLRNPLTAIKNADYFLRKKCAGCNQIHVAPMFDVIDKSINHANKIINDLLDYSREIHLDLSECSPRTLAIQALTMMQVPENVQILNYIPDNIRLYVDESKIVRVFANIMKNAFDAMPKGGNLELRANQENEHVKIEFSDTGSGIPKEAIDKIFTPLFTTKAQGMGFGLPICKRVVEAHKGKILVESTSVKGTKFIVKLPYKPNLVIEPKETFSIPTKIVSS